MGNKLTKCKAIKKVSVYFCGRYAWNGVVNPSRHRNNLA